MNSRATARSVRPIRARMSRVLAVAAAVLVVLIAALWTFQRHLIYYPATFLSPVAVDVPRGRPVVLQTEDGLRLGATFVAPRDREGVVVLVANGNGGDRALRAPLARALADRGLGVLLFDYRGYGGNDGRPSEAGLARDARAARTFLVEEVGVSPHRLVYFGESLGSAVVTRLAKEHPPGGLVLRSPFVDLASVGRRHYPFLPVRLLLRDRYPLAEQLRDVRVPVTVVYGTNDSLIPPAESRQAAQAAPHLRRLVEVEGADHNDLSLLDGPALIEAIDDMADAVRTGGS